MDHPFLFQSTTCLPIPDCWTPEQALLVIDFLHSVIAAIQCQYASDLSRYLQPLTPPDPHDDIPF